MQSDKNIPPDVQIERDAVTIRCGERETIATKDGIRIRERRKSYPASKRLVRLLSANFTNPETVLRLEYERGDTDAGFEDGDDVGCLPRGNAGDRGDGAQRGSL